MEDRQFPHQYFVAFASKTPLSLYTFPDPKGLMERPVSAKLSPLKKKEANAI